MYNQLLLNIERLNTIAGKFNVGYEEAFCKRHPRFAKGGPSTTHLHEYTGPFTVKVAPLSGSQGGVAAEVTVSNELVTLLSFRLERFPSCCALYMMHHFSYNDNPLLDTAILHEFMDEVFHSGTRECEAIHGNYDMYMNNLRIHIMMVEMMGIARLRPLLKVDDDVRVLRLIDIPPIDNPNMQYPKFYEYFKSKARCNERLFFNVNSDNIIHDMEVVLK